MACSSVDSPKAGIHEQWGGVVPRLAQEGHRKADANAMVHMRHEFVWPPAWPSTVQAIDETVEEALRRAGRKHFIATIGFA